MTEPLTTQLFTYPDTRDLVGQVQAALVELANRADAPRVEDALLREQISQHERWSARRDLGQQIVDRVDPRTTGGDGPVNTYGYAEPRMPRPEEPMPASWHRALEVVGALLDQQQQVAQSLDEIELTARNNHNLLLALVDQTGSGKYAHVGDSGLTNVLAGFVRQVRIGLVDDDHDFRLTTLDELGASVAAQHAELVALRAHWNAVPIHTRNLILQTVDAPVTNGDAIEAGLIDELPDDRP